MRARYLTYLINVAENVIDAGYIELLGLQILSAAAEADVIHTASRGEDV